MVSYIISGALQNEHSRQEINSALWNLILKKINTALAIGVKTGVAGALSK